MREKGDDFSGRRRRFWGRRGMVLKRGEGKDLEGGGGRLGRGNKKTSRSCLGLSERVWILPGWVGVVRVMT